MTELRHDLLVLAGLVLVGAGLLLVQLALMRSLLRAARLPRALRVLGLLPPLTPVAGFLGGARGLAVAWCVLALLYFVLRTQA